MIEIILIPLLDILYFYLLQFPGAVIRWLLAGGKKPLREFLEKDRTYKNFFAGFCLFFVAALAYSLLK